MPISLGDHAGDFTADAKGPGPFNHLRITIQDHETDDRYGGPGRLHRTESTCQTK